MHKSTRISSAHVSYCMRFSFLLIGVCPWTLLCKVGCLAPRGLSASALYYTFLSFSFSHQNINHHHLTCCVSNVHTTAIAQQFPVAMSVAKMSVTIKNMLDDLGEDDDQPIPLPNVSNNSIFQLAYIYL